MNSETETTAPIGVGIGQKLAKNQDVSIESEGKIEPSEGASGAIDSSVEEEWAVETACYLCYAQCVNFGVQGKGGRPCAKGVSDIIKQRHKLRLERKAAASAASGKKYNTSF